MRLLDTARRRLGVVLVAGVLLPAGVVTATAAQAAPSTKYYTATVSPQQVDSGVSQQAFTLTLSNCGPSSGCTKTSQQTLGSANIQVDPAFANVTASVSTPGWFVVQPVTNGLVELRSSGTALSPGQSLAISVLADTPAGVGAYTWSTQVKQSNNFSGTGNDFTLSGSQPQVLVGFPDHLAFVTQPSTVQATTSSSTSYICPAPSVQVVEADGTPVTVGSAQVAVQADTSFGDPKLGGTTSAATVNGLATFGSADCSSGISARTVGGGYQLQATATWTFGAYHVSLSTAQDSAAFDVVQVLTVCSAGSSCTATTNGSHTKAVVDASSAVTVDDLEIAVGIDSLAHTTCLPQNEPSGLEVVRVLIDHRSKTVTLTFDKFLVNQAPNNGTPLFTICFAAPWGNWVTDSGSAPTFNTVTNEYEGVLPTCGDAGLVVDNPCVSDRSKNAGNEIVSVLVPYQDGRADPKLW